MSDLSTLLGIGAIGGATGKSEWEPAEFFAAPSRPSSGGSRPKQAARCGSRAWTLAMDRPALHLLSPRLRLEAAPQPLRSTARKAARFLSTEPAGSLRRMGPVVAK